MNSFLQKIDPLNDNQPCVCVRTRVRAMPQRHKLCAYVCVCFRARVSDICATARCRRPQHGPRGRGRGEGGEGKRGRGGVGSGGKGGESGVCIDWRVWSNTETLTPSPACGVGTCRAAMRGYCYLVSGRQISRCVFGGHWM